MLASSKSPAIFESHRYQVEARQARLLAEARRDRIKVSRLVGSISTRFRDHRLQRTPQEF